MRHDDVADTGHRGLFLRPLPGVLAVMLVAGLLVAGWLCLPAIFPDWIIRHSPWTDQIIRASAAGVRKRARRHVLAGAIRGRCRSAADRVSPGPRPRSSP